MRSSHIQLGISPINWSNDDDPTLGGDISFEQCIKEMSDAQFSGTEIGNKFPRDPHILNSKLNSAGLKIPSAWFSTFFTEPDKYDDTLSRFLDFFSFLRAIGARYINVAECGQGIQQTNTPILGPHKVTFTSQQWEALIQGLHQLGRIANDFDLTLVYHHHLGTGVQSEEDIHFLMEHTCPDLISLLLDTGHARAAGMEPLKLLTQYSHRIPYIHLKDVRSDVLKKTEQQQWNFMQAVRAGIFTVPGDGDINFAPIVAQLRNNEYRGWLMVEAEQDPSVAPPFDYAQKAHAYLSGLLGE